MRSVILIFLMVGAALASPAQITTPIPYNPGGQGAAPAASAAGAAGAAPRANVPGVSGLMGGFIADANYKLRVGDTVSFQVKEDIIWRPDDAPKALTVTDSGEIDIPYIGRVMAVDKTCGELAADIKKALEKDYYQTATVVMSLDQANRVLGRIFIYGAVRAQGPIEMGMNENLTAGEAILRAGGLSDFASKHDVQVVRATPGPNEDKVVKLDMGDILEKGHTENDIVLKPGDYIMVPTRIFNF